MNKKAQGGPVTHLFNMLFFFIFLGIAGGTLWGLIALASVSAGLTGLEAFILENFAIFVVCTALLATFGFLYFGGGQ